MSEARFEQRNATAPGAVSPADSFERAFMEIGTKSYSGKTVTESTALGISAVYRCVNILAGSLSMMTANVMRESDDGELTIDRNHYLTPVISKSFDDNWSAVRGWRFIAEQILLRGNAIARYSVAPNGRVNRLMPIHVDRCTFLPQQDGSLKYLITGKDGITREYTGNSILHLRNIESDDLGIGLSTITAARNTMGLAMSSEEASSKLFANGLITPGFVTGPTLNAKSKDNWKAGFEKEYVGARNTFRTPLLEGDLKYVRTGLSPADVQFLDTRKLSLLEIAIIFGVPPNMLGLSDAGKTSAEQQAISFLVYTLQPLIRLIEQEVEHTLLSSQERKSISICFDTDALLRTDQKTRYEAYSAGVMSGVLKPSEARRKENLKPDPAGDELVVNAATVKLKDAGIQWTGKQQTNTEASEPTNV